MKLGFLDFLRESLKDEQPVAPIDRLMAKRWVKERLKRLFPHLRNDPVGLERAYKELGIQAHDGAGKGGTTIYEIKVPEK
jgi:hypothetical protein